MAKKKQLTTTDYKEMLNEAKQHQDYWEEGFKLALEEAAAVHQKDFGLSDEQMSDLLGVNYVKFLRGEIDLTMELVFAILFKCRLDVTFTRKE